MRKSEFFKPIQQEVERNKEAKTEPMTAEEHEETEEKPMRLKDHWLSLRYAIQDKLTIEKPTNEQQEKIKLFSELVTPELMGGYRQILKDFKAKSRKSEQHPQREFIDINNEEISEKIGKWIDSLIIEVKNKKEVGFDENDVEELRQQCWLFFDAMGNVINTKSLEHDINDFYEDKTEKGGKKELLKQKTELIEDLQGHYDLDKAEAEILIDLIRPDKSGLENYSLTTLLETIDKLTKQYKLGGKKGKLGKIMLQYLTVEGAQSYAPMLFGGMFGKDGEFNVKVFLTFLGINGVADIVKEKTHVELAKVMNEIDHQINQRITDSLFFQEFEFMHEKSLGDIYAVLERGKSSTRQILQEVISEFTPALSGIIMSLGFLTSINPALGGIGLLGLPIMYKISKKHGEKIESIGKEEAEKEREIGTRLGSVHQGLEELRTSSVAPEIARETKEDMMDAKDTLSLEKYKERAGLRIKNIITFDVSQVGAAIVGGAMMEAGEISGGEVLSTIQYSNKLYRPINQLVEMYFSKFPVYVQDIERMEKVLGKYEKLDLPEGEKEQSRVPVSELENYDISIKDLRYKNILRGVSLDVKQGEFLTIAGASGEGKSTLLRNLVGLYKPDGGEIEIGGVKNDGIKKYGKESLYSIMSYCNQNPQIFDGMTLRENLLLWSKEEVDDEAIKSVLKDLHLEKFTDKLDYEAKNLSGGEKVRIGVARTLIKGAKIMLMDEPTASLDSQAANEVRKIIGEIREKYPDRTIICVSHDDKLIQAGSRSVNMADLQK